MEIVPYFIRYLHAHFNYADVLYCIFCTLFLVSAKFSGTRLDKLYVLRFIAPSCFPFMLCLMPPVLASAYSRNLEPQHFIGN
jgi:hypothetical protein